MKQITIFRLTMVLLLMVGVSCKKENIDIVPTENRAYVRTIADSILDNWHKAASNANFEEYFGSMTTDAIFTGTDATEHWGINEFKDFSKPYFDRGKAWDLKPLERNIFVSEDNSIVWFDELLDTWMGVCRGSGVIKKENDQWKIAHYVLSVTVPNDDINSVLDIKKETDSILTRKLELKLNI